MKRLVVDIGSNTIKCLFAELESGKLTKIYEKTLDNRISAGGRLVDNAAEIIITSLEDFVSEAKRYSDEFQILAVATSALREAERASEIICKVEQSTKIRIQILSGEDEARVSYSGAMSDEALPLASVYSFFDLGGGSIELAFGDKKNVCDFCSLPLGAVTMTRAFLPDEPPSKNQIQALRSHIRSEFEEALGGKSLPRGGVLVGVGGAVVAARFMKRVSAFTGNEFEITRAEISTMLETISAITPQERSRKFSIPASRADIIPAAFVCIEVLMDFLGAEKLFHTFCNLRYGLIVADEFWG